MRHATRLKNADGAPPIPTCLRTDTSGLGAGPRRTACRREQEGKSTWLALGAVGLWGLEVWGCVRVLVLLGGSMIPCGAPVVLQEVVSCPACRRCRRLVRVVVAYGAPADRWMHRCHSPQWLCDTCRIEALAAEEQCVLLLSGLLGGLWKGGSLVAMRSGVMLYLGVCLVGRAGSWCAFERKPRRFAVSQAQ